MRQVRDFETLKLLADERRLTILRLLMAGPATLSQLGQVLEEHPAQVRHHVKLLEQVGLVEMVETRVVRGFTEKYYRARARAFVLQQLILPIAPGSEPAHPNAFIFTVIGSHDLALEMLLEAVNPPDMRPLEMAVIPAGSMDGLVALRQGLSHLTGCHLYDPAANQYNIPFIRHLFPDRDIRLMTLAHRLQGLMIAPGNPKGIHSLSDLARGEVSLINRNRGSGTRLWLDNALQQAGLAIEGLRGYEREVRTHTAAAEAIRAGRADVGVGLCAAAERAGLDFIPLFEERFDLAIPPETRQNTRLAPLFDTLTSTAFRQSVAALPGYNAEHTGEIVY